MRLVRNVRLKKDENYVRLKLRHAERTKTKTFYDRMNKKQIYAMQVN